MKRCREEPDDRGSKRQKLNNKRAKLTDHRYTSSHPAPYPDSKSSQLSPVSPRMSSKKHRTKYVQHFPSGILTDSQSVSLILCHITLRQGGSHHFEITHFPNHCPL